MEIASNASQGATGTADEMWTLADACEDRRLEVARHGDDGGAGDQAGDEDGADAAYEPVASMPVDAARDDDRVELLLLPAQQS